MGTSTIGKNTLAVVKVILSFNKVEQQGYRAYMGLSKLADKYGIERLENACSKALNYTPAPNFKNVDSILKSGQDKINIPKDENFYSRFRMIRVDVKHIDFFAILGSFIICT